MLLSPYQVALSIEGGGRERVIARLGDGLPVAEGGVGGWQVVPRPQQAPLTVWRGPEDGRTLALPLMLDGFDEGLSVEADCRTLEDLAGFGGAEPPRLRVSGNLPSRIVAGTGSVARFLWVITELEWGEAIRRSADGHRIRQAVTVHLLQYVEDERLERIRRPSSRPTARFTKARAGDTYETIAGRSLKSKRLGTRLAKLNGKRSADLKLKSGDRVRLPSASALADWRRDLRR